MGVLWFTACQPATGTQTGYSAMPAMPQQGEDGCKECTLKKGRTAEENSFYPDTNKTRGLLLVSPLVTMHAVASEGTPPRRIGLKMQENSLPAVP